MLNLDVVTTVVECGSSVMMSIETCKNIQLGIIQFNVGRWLAGDPAKGSQYIIIKQPIVCFTSYLHTQQVEYKGITNQYTGNRS